MLYIFTAQIDSWLESLPSDMESYIRPGCLVLTIFVSMPSVGWIEVSWKYIISLCYFMFQGCSSLVLAVLLKFLNNLFCKPFRVIDFCWFILLTLMYSCCKQLDKDLHASVRKLLSLCSDDFWHKGRILVQVEHQTVFISDGQSISQVLGFGVDPACNQHF